MEVISGLPLNNFTMAFPRNKPIKQMPNVITVIIDTCSQTVALFDNPA